MGMDRPAAVRAIADFLRALGFDSITEPDLAGTPERVADAFGNELLSGYAVNVPELIRKGLARSRFGENRPVAITDIAVATVCPHHLLPALGVAHVVYVPGASVLGIGTVAAVVDAFARRLALQELIAEQVVSALVEYAGAHGAYCELVLEHACLRARGERQTAALVRTSARAGNLASPDRLPEIAQALGRSPPP